MSHPHGVPPQINLISLIQSCPHDVSQPVSNPNGVPPQINPISPIQSCAPKTYPINQSHCTDPTRVACPTAHPHKSIPSPWSSQCGVPPWQAPLNQSHHPVPASATHRHKSTPLPRSSQCRVSPWNNSITLIQPVSHLPWFNPIAPIQLVCGAPDRRSPLAALAQPPSDTTHVSVTTPLTPTLIQSPSPLLPYAPDSFLPPFIPAWAFRTLSTTPSVSVPCPPPTLVLSFTVPIVPLPSVIRPPDQCRPRTPYNICLLHPLPSSTPLPPST